MNTKKLKQLVLDLAIHGKLVPQDPNDEPASELLKRIQADVETHGRASNKSKGKKTAVSSVDLEVPFEVPEGWEWTPVEDFLLVLSGQDFEPSKYNDKKIGLPYIIGASNFDNGSIIENRWTETPSVIAKKNDLLLVCKGAGVGKLALCNLEEAHIARQVQAIRDVSGFCSMQYIKYAVLIQIEHVISLANGLIPGLKREVILSTLIPLPPLAEQHRIVAAIEKWFAVIDQLEKNEADLKKSIEQTKKKVLDLAIRGKLVAQNPEDEPAGESIKRINPKAEILFESDEYGEVPEGWCLTPLIEVCSFESGYAYDSNLYQSNGVPLVRISNINNGVVTTDDCVCIEDDPSRKNIYIENGDVLIAMSGATTGKMGVYKSKERAILNQRVGCVRVKSNIILKEYRNMFLQSQSDLILKLAYGGAQPNISGKMISSLLVPLPPIAEQKRIVEKVEEVMRVLERIEGMM